MYGSAAAIILELATIGLLVIGILTGVKKGFFKSLMDFLILIAAVLIASQICKWASAPLTDLFYPKAEERVLKAIGSVNIDLSKFDLSGMKLDESHPDTLNETEYEQLKKSAGIGDLIEALERAGIPKARIWKIVAETLKKVNVSGSNLKEILTDTARTATKSGLTAVVQVILFILVVLIVSVLLQILVNGTKRLIWKVDLLKTTDRFLGFLLGAVMMLGIILIAFYIFDRIHWIKFETAVGQTLFAAFINENNPLRLLIK